MPEINWLKWEQGYGWDSASNAVTDGDRYFQSLDEYASHVLEQFDQQAIALKDLPQYIWACRRRYCPPLSLSQVISGLIDDFRNEEQGWRQEPSWMPSMRRAGPLMVAVLEEFYESSEIDVAPTIQGSIFLDAVLARFYRRNKWVWRFLLNRPWFQPELHSLGIDDLRLAIDRIMVANRNHFFLVQSDLKIQLTDLFWAGKMFDSMTIDDILDVLSERDQEKLFRVSISEWG